MLGAHAQVGQAVRDQVRADWGLDRSPIEQYLAYLGRLVTGDLGRSYQLGQPVAEVIGQQLPSTVALAVAAIVLAVALALLGALLGRTRVGSAVTSVVELVAVSAPTFWTGLLLLSLFGFALGWFPVLASGTPAALVLPAVTLAIPVSGLIGQVLREGVDDALGRANTVSTSTAPPRRVPTR